MLSAVLRSDTAIDVSIQIIDAFVEMRHFIAGNAQMFEQIRTIERRQIAYESETDKRFEQVFNFMEAHAQPTQKVFFEGQVWDAFELLTSLIRRAQRLITLVDNYVDTGTLNILAKKQPGVTVTVWTHPKTKLTQQDIDTFNAQYPRLTVHHSTAFHDRFLVIDNNEGYLVGASLKDAGKKGFAITKLESKALVASVMSELAA